MLEELVQGSLLLPSVLLSSVFMLVLFSVLDWSAEREREKRRQRREKILRNTKEEAIKQAREPIIVARKPGDEETEGLGSVVQPLEASVVRARV